MLDGVTEQRSMITEREMKARAYELSAGTSRPAETDGLVSDLHRSGELVRLEDGLWTTRELREREQQAIQTSESRAREKTAPVNKETSSARRRSTGRPSASPKIDGRTSRRAWTHNRESRPVPPATTPHKYHISHFC